MESQKTNKRERLSRLFPEKKTTGPTQVMNKFVHSHLYRLKQHAKTVQKLNCTVHIQNSPIQKSPKHQKKVLKNSPIQNSSKPFEFLDLDILAPTELIYALKTQTWL